MGPKYKVLVLAAKSYSLPRDMPANKAAPQAKHHGKSGGKDVTGQDVVIADAPQRKKRRRRAPRIVFPDPDRGRKPKQIPAVHLTTWEEYSACIHTRGRSPPVWKMQRAFRVHRLFRESVRRRHRRERAAAAAAIPACGHGTAGALANEGPPPV